MIKITPFTYKLLLNTKISNLADGTVNKNYKRENDFILKKHNKHYNTILIGEYGLTRIFLKNKLKPNIINLISKSQKKKITSLNDVNKLLIVWNINIFNQ